MLKYLVFFLFLFTKFTVSSQISFTSNQVIEPYLGFPNLGRFSLEFFSDSINKENKEFSGLAPSGLRYSYMLNDVISLGVDVIYNSISENSSTVKTIFMNNEWLTQTNFMTIKLQRLRLHARINFHFPVSSAMSDSYLGLGFGTNSKWKKTIMNGNNIEELSGRKAVLFPFSLRVCYGYRYYFNYNWGIQGEVGLGGPLLSVGLSYKI